MTFGEKLRKARKEAGLSQEQFAEKMSVSRSAIAKWESDRGMPDVNNLRIMAQLLGVSVDYLLDEDEKLSFNETKEAIDQAKDYIDVRVSDEEKERLKKNINEAAEAVNEQVKVAQSKINEFISKPEVRETLDKAKESAAELAKKGAEALKKVLDKNDK